MSDVTRFLYLFTTDIYILTSSKKSFSTTFNWKVMCQFQSLFFNFNLIRYFPDIFAVNESKNMKKVTHSKLKFLWLTKLFKILFSKTVLIFSTLLSNLKN